MIRKYFLIVMAILTGIVLSGCAKQTVQPVAEENESGPVETICPDVRMDQCVQIPTEHFIKKVDNFMIIFDPSASMSEEYSNGVTKFNFAKEIAGCLNRTIPDFELKGALRTFGAPVYTAIDYGIEVYLKEDLAHALKGVKSADGASPLDFAIRAAGKDWDSEQGKIALIIISDGVDMDIDPVLAAEEIKKQYGENICIYTILIGKDHKGRNILSQVAEAGECGFMVDGVDLAPQAGMEDFVRKIFLARDCDGVLDKDDECPKTPAGPEDDQKECHKLIIPANVLFDFDKSVVKQEGYQALNEITEILKMDPSLSLEIHGHTDYMGTEKYNDVLSNNRAKAGKQYLADKGIEAHRISVMGFGELQPVSTNQTDNGRALNRRIEFRFVR